MSDYEIQENIVSQKEYYDHHTDSFIYSLIRNHGYIPLLLFIMLAGIIFMAIKYPI